MLYNYRIFFIALMLLANMIVYGMEDEKQYLVIEALSTDELIKQLTINSYVTENEELSSPNFRTLLDQHNQQFTTFATTLLDTTLPLSLTNKHFSTHYLLYTMCQVIGRKVIVIYSFHHCNRFSFFWE